MQEHTQKVLKIAAVGDIHCTKTSQKTLQPFFNQIVQRADVLILCGDLTDNGLPEEAHVLAREITVATKLPILAVLGNHDYQSSKADELTQIFTDLGILMMDGDAHEIEGVGFAGVKGFAGGFGRHTLGAWGEDIIKRFVHEAVEEALKLEAALSRLRTKQRIGVLHYSPIMETVVGEPVEIYPFLGTSRLEEPLLRYQVNNVFHGHAHRGTMEGHMANGANVYNVCLPLLRRAIPDHPPFRIIEIAVGTNLSDTEDLF